MVNSSRFNSSTIPEALDKGFSKLHRDNQARNDYLNSIDGSLSVLAGLSTAQLELAKKKLIEQLELFPRMYEVLDDRSDTEENARKYNLLAEKETEARGFLNSIIMEQEKKILGEELLAKIESFNPYEVVYGKKAM